jgi:hypothetical protein
MLVPSFAKSCKIQDDFPQLCLKGYLNLSNTTAHTDLDGNHKNATATITFTDDSTLLADDETDLYWYILVGVPVQYTKF